MKVSGVRNSGCTCDRLRKAGRLSSRIYDRELQPVGLNIGQWSLLSRLKVSGGTTIGALAEALAMDRTTLTRNLKPLQRDGLVELGQGEDRRTSIVRLTKKGTTLWFSALPLWEKAQDEMRRLIGIKAQLALNRILDETIATMEPARITESSL